MIPESIGYKQDVAFRVENTLLEAWRAEIVADVFVWLLFLVLIGTEWMTFFHQTTYAQLYLQDNFLAKNIQNKHTQ